MSHIVFNLHFSMARDAKTKRVLYVKVEFKRVGIGFKLIVTDPSTYKHHTWQPFE